MQKIIKSAEIAITTSHTTLESVGGAAVTGTGVRTTRGRNDSTELVASDQRPMNAEDSTAWNSTRRDPTSHTLACGEPSFL